MAARCMAAATLVLLLGTGLAPAAPVPINLGPGQPQAYAWQADESWPGGRLADGRLDRPVRFWRAGLSLPEVFAGIEKQTGVAIGIWPPQDPLARLRVNLYLNEEHPPTLREVMAQLSWAMRASSACTDGPGRRYFLLGTGEATGAYDRLAAAREARRQQGLRERRRQALAALERYRPALGLPRAEAIKRYEGKDDLLLLTLLDPEQQRSLRLLCSLSHEQLATLEKEGTLEVGPADLTAEQRASFAGGTEEGWRAYIEAGPSFRWSRGGAGIRVSFARECEDQGEARYAGWPVVAAQTDARPEVALEVRRLLGEVFTKSQEQEFLNAAYRRWMKEAREQGDRESRARMLVSQELSAAAAGQLERITITWKGGDESAHPLWQVQEAVAKASGLNVVSDCVTPWPRQFVELTPLVPGAREQRDASAERRRQFRLEHREEWTTLREAGRDPEAELKVQEQFPEPVFEVNMRDWLTALCVSRSTEEAETIGAPDQWWEGWEWGDAGSFLHFRAAYPEVWRAAMLPEPVERAMEEAIQPYLRQAAEGELPPEAPFPLDIQAQIRLVAQCDGLQPAVSESLTRADPSTAAGQLHDGLVVQIVRHLEEVGGSLHFLATLREDQWEALRTTGLRVDELTATQREAFPIVDCEMNYIIAATGEEVHRDASMLVGVLQEGGRLLFRWPGEDEMPGGGKELEADLLPPLQTEVALPPPLIVSRKE